MQRGRRLISAGCYMLAFVHFKRAAATVFDVATRDEFCGRDFFQLKNLVSRLCCTIVFLVTNVKLSAFYESLHS